MRLQSSLGHSKFINGYIFHRLKREREAPFFLWWLTAGIIILLVLSTNPAQPLSNKSSKRSCCCWQRKRWRQIERKTQCSLSSGLGSFHTLCHTLDFRSYHWGIAVVSNVPEHVCTGFFHSPNKPFIGHVPGERFWPSSLSYCSDAYRLLPLGWKCPFFLLSFSSEIP